MGLKAMDIISGLRIVTPIFQPNVSNNEPTFNDIFFLELNWLAIMRSTSRFLVADSLKSQSGDEGLICPTLTLKGWSSYLFFTQLGPFPNSYYNANSSQLIFVNYIENFENCPWEINVQKELLRELELCKENLVAIKESIVVTGGDTKPKVV